MMTWINRGNRATKTGFGEGLLAAGAVNPRILALGADITTSVGVNLFAERFPERFISLGIAEQNCTAFSAGLALEGFIPVFATYGVFSAFRSADQVRISVCYNNLHVIIGGAHAGVSVGPDGATHQALEDIAIMRALPHMTVLSPCDATQAALAVEAACNRHSGPVYIRFGREAMPDFTTADLPFEIGKGQVLQDGSDVTLIATGHLVWESLEAAALLAGEGIHARVINIHTIKPLDEEAILKAARETRFLVTAEEHQVAGGLGSAVAELVSQRYPVPVSMTGMQDRFGESGTPRELMEKYGLTSETIVRKVKDQLQAR